jgi:hypothetical protein
MVMIPMNVIRRHAYTRKTSHTTLTPGFRALLYLQQHVSAGVVVREQMNIVEYQDQGLAILLMTAQGDLFELIKC